MKLLIQTQLQKRGEEKQRIKIYFHLFVLHESISSETENLCAYMHSLLWLLWSQPGRPDYNLLLRKLRRTNQWSQYKLKNMNIVINYY